MKKIIASIFVLIGLIGFGSVSVSYAEDCNWAVLKNWECCPHWNTPYDKDNNGNYKKCCKWKLYGNNENKCCEQSVWVLSDDKKKCISCFSQEAKTLANYKFSCSEDLSNCPANKKYVDSDWIGRCCADWIVQTDSKTQQKVCILNLEWDMGINMNPDCLINGQCSMNIYKTLWIRKSDQNPSVGTFVQDIILWITMFLGTVIALILVTSWILYILAAIQWKSSLADMAKKWIVNSILWLIFVTWSYAIVRLIQFVATAWWG